MEAMELATHDDLARLESRMDTKFAELRGEFSELRGETDSGFAGIRADFAELRGEMNSQFSRVDAKFSQLETTLTRRMYAAMGVWTVLLGSAFAWASALLR